MRRASWPSVLIVITLWASGRAAAQPFLFDLRRTDLANTVFGRIIPADVDADGDVDLVVSGASGLEADAPRLVLAGAGEGSRDDVEISYSSVALPDPIWLGAGTWFDADRDGRPDLLMTGSPSIEVGAVGLPSATRTALYLSAPDGSLVAMPSGLPDVYAGAVAWADADLDGDSDVLISGIDRSGATVTDLYLNDGAGRFTAAGSGLPAVALGAASWADVDGDGDPDLALSGLDAQGAFHSVVALNTDGSLVVNQVLEPLAYSSLDWGDYDADGDPDLVLSGARLSRTAHLVGVSILYRNDGGTLVECEASIPGVLYGSVRWGDFDQDGDLDLAVAGLGTLAANPIAAVLENAEGTFVTRATLPGAFGGTMEWADVDGDDDLDLILSGQDASAIGFVRVVANVSRIANHPPAAPDGLQATVDGRSVTLRWQPAADDHTPPVLLTYNVRVGTATGLQDVRSAVSGADGRRLVAAPGNAGSRTEVTLRSLAQGTYTWSVQAIDASFRGSSFSEEGTFSVAGLKAGATGSEDGSVPATFALDGPYPNPTSGGASLDIDLPWMSPVRVEIFDVRGRRVALAADTVLPAGRHTIAWSGRADSGHLLAPSVYPVVVTMGSRREVRWLVRTAGAQGGSR